jgi:hypothetical protein
VDSRDSVLSAPGSGYVYHLHCATLSIIKDVSQLDFLIGYTLCNLYFSLINEGILVLCRLSSYLANITLDDTYLEAANQSGTFLLANFMVGAPGNGIPTIDSRGGKYCLDSTLGAWFENDPDPAALLILGLSYWPNNSTLYGQTIVEL